MSGESGTTSSRSSAAGGSASGVAKAKARTSASIPAMRATGVLRESPASVLATPGAPRSDKLEEEARRMEERLAQLKVAMTTEKQKREAITKTKAGKQRETHGWACNDVSLVQRVLLRAQPYTCLLFVFHQVRFGRRPLQSPITRATWRT
jgi:hypothetical protein